MEIIYTDSYEEALSLRDKGYEPIECAFGSYGSVMGELALDHHGNESHREGVAIRSCRDFYAARREDPRFVVTGTPDADAILSILALSGGIDSKVLPPGFPELVDLHDRNPIGLDLTDSENGLLLLAFNQESLPRKKRGFEKGLEIMSRLLSEGIDDEQKRRIRGTERSRMRRAHESVRRVIGAGGCDLPVELPQQGEEKVSVAVILGAVWGFDIWYQYAPVVVSYSARLEKVTIGCPSPEKAEALFGPGGLLNVYPKLGVGWGGREAVGGSPRGEKRVFEDAEATALHLSRLLEGDD